MKCTEIVTPMHMPLLVIIYPDFTSFAQQMASSNQTNFYVNIFLVING